MYKEHVTSFFGDNTTEPHIKLMLIDNWQVKRTQPFKRYTESSSISIKDALTM